MLSIKDWDKTKLQKLYNLLSPIPAWEANKPGLWTRVVPIIRLFLASCTPVIPWWISLPEFLPWTLAMEALEVWGLQLSGLSPSEWQKSLLQHSSCINLIPGQGRAKGQRARLPGNSDGCFSFTSYPGKVSLGSICRGRTAGCRAVMWAGCHLFRSLMYFSKCTPQFQLL